MIIRVTNAIKTLPHTATRAFFSLRRYFDSSPDAVRRAAPFLAVTLFAFCLTAGYALLAPSPSGPYGSSVCLPINFQTLGPQDFPDGQNTRFPLEGRQAGSARQYAAVSTPLGSGAMVSGRTLSVGPEHWHYKPTPFVPPPRKGGMINFTQGMVSIELVDGPVLLAQLRDSPIPTMASAPDLFQSDMFTLADYTDSDIPPLLYGEKVDEAGLPVRWGRPANTLPGLMACNLTSSYHSELHSMLRRARFDPNANHSARANQFKTVARRYAQKYNLAFPMVLAIMHTESNFNPFAVSRSHAIGLMQIVPETAGNEVYRYLTGLPGTPNLETLFSPEHNIRYGTTYLHLLGRRYFGDVINPRSRQMCVIAAYNGGPGAVLRVFGSDRERAITRINALSPDDVYKILTTDLPHAETRRYVDLVLARMQSYSAY